MSCSPPSACSRSTRSSTRSRRSLVAVERSVDATSSRAFGAPDRPRLLLLDVIVFARRDPHVAAILRAGLDTYLREMRQANDAGVALACSIRRWRSDDLARVLALLILGKVVYEALGGTPPSEQAFVRLADVLLHAAEPGDESERPAALARVRRTGGNAGEGTAGARRRRRRSPRAGPQPARGGQRPPACRTNGSGRSPAPLSRVLTRRRPADGVRPANSTSSPRASRSAPYLDAGPPPRPARGDLGEPAGDIAVQRSGVALRPARDGNRFAHRVGRARDRPRLPDIGCLELQRRRVRRHRRLRLLRPPRRRHPERAPRW